MAGQIREKNNPDQNDETFKIVYELQPNFFSVRVHYDGHFVVKPPKFSYEGGKTELFDYCDADTFEIRSIESWAFRLGLRKGDFEMCVYHDPVCEGLNGLRPLKSGKNVVQFVLLTSEFKFLDVYLVKFGNTGRFENLEDEYGNLKLSETSINILKAKEVERARLQAEKDCEKLIGVVDFNLDDANVDTLEENEEEGVQNDESDNTVEENEEESDEDDNTSEEGSDVEAEDGELDDLQYGKEHDCFEDGELDDTQPNLTARFLEEVEQEFVVPAEEMPVENDVEVAVDVVVEQLSRKNKGKGKQPVMKRFDARSIPTNNEGTAEGARNKKKYKGPYARHGVQFKERRLAGWVPTSSDESADGKSDNMDSSDFDSGDSTSDSDVGEDMHKVTNESRKKRRYVHFNEKNIKNPDLFPGLVFSSSTQFKEVMRWYAAVRRKDIWFTCNESHRFGARCQYPCDWAVWLSRDKKLNDKDLVIKTISKKHNDCISAKRRKLLKSTWLAKVLLDWFRLLPDMSLNVLTVAIDKKFGLMVTNNQARRIREKALKSIEGDHNDQYDQVFDYIEELKKTHPGSTVFAEWDPSPEDSNAGVFKRIYVCLRPLIQGFKVGCRKLIGLDGCHTKGLHKMQILTAVALDPNNGWWPLCWAIVEKENKETWKWFIQTLAYDLEIVDEEDYVIISDKQKGLQGALNEVLPRVEHRNCVQHIYRNFKRHHGSQLLRDKLWACARASTRARFNAAMLDLKETDISAHAWVVQNAGNPSHWCKAFFSIEVQSDMLCNNLSESFNSFILSARDKPIITMLERIRRLIMERIKDRKLSIGTKSGTLCPRITKILDKRLNSADGLTYGWNGADGFEVVSHNNEQFKVDIKRKECSCRLWQLTGIPCNHAIPTIYAWKLMPADLVSSNYKLTTFGLLYENVLQPINGPSEWEKTNNITLLPPKYVRQPGRPKLSRKKDITEVQKSKGKEKLTRWFSHTCKYCGIQGHNVRTCTKKKSDHEAGGSNVNTQQRNVPNNEDDDNDPERAAHEKYLHDLYDWMNDITNTIATNIPGATVTPIAQPQTPVFQANQQGIVLKTPTRQPIILTTPQQPKRQCSSSQPVRTKRICVVPTQSAVPTISSSQPIPTTRGVMTRSALKRSSQGG